MSVASTITHHAPPAAPHQVLDLLMPPYDDGRLRDCHYFALCDAPCDAPDAPHTQLRVSPPPPSLVIRRADYRGPAVAPSTCGQDTALP